MTQVRALLASVHHGKKTEKLNMGLQNIWISGSAIKSSFNLMQIVRQSLAPFTNTVFTGKLPINDC